MLIFAVGIVVFALAPVLFSLGYYVTDVWQVLQTQSTEGLALWQVWKYFTFPAHLCQLNETILSLGILSCSTLVCLLDGGPASSSVHTILCPHSTQCMEGQREWSCQENQLKTSSCEYLPLILLHM